MSSEKPDDAKHILLTDAQLWVASTQGDVSAFEMLYARHAGLVYGIALKVLNSPPEAENLTQDIFLKMVKGSAYDPRRGTLRTYLAILTRSRAIDRVRSRQTARKTVRSLQADQAMPSSSSPLDQVSRHEQHQVVKTALAQLSESQRQVLKMAYYEGLTQAVIAERLDTPLGTIKARARRGLIKLRQLLQDPLDRQ